jgi:bla regulator protein blaR1
VPHSGNRAFREYDLSDLKAYNPLNQYSWAGISSLGRMMRTHFKHTCYGRKLFLKVILPALTSALFLAQLSAQSPGQSQAPYWQTTAGGKMVFDSVTVRQNKTAPAFEVGSNFPLGPGDVYVPTGGMFAAANYPLITYILFAYKITGNQEQSLISQLPKWAITDRFDIQGKAQGNPSKDQMRLMVQALLADRFHLAVRYETRQVPVFAVILDRPGTLGPLLQKHPDGSPCATSPAFPSPAPAAPPQFLDTRFPATCGGVVPMPPSASGRVRWGARNVPMGLIATSMGDGEGVDRPELDKTGLTGLYDFAIEYTPQLTPSSPPGANSRRDPTGPTFLQALRDQLGLRLEPQMGPMDFLMISSVEEPSTN